MCQGNGGPLPGFLGGIFQNPCYRTTKSPSRAELNRRIRMQLVQQFRDSGLLNGCPTMRCYTPVFTVWEANLTCNGCGKPLEILYDLRRPWE